MAEGEGFEPPVGVNLRLISSQVLSTTQPPFQLHLIQTLAQLKITRTCFVLYHHRESEHKTA